MKTMFTTKVPDLENDQPLDFEAFIYYLMSPEERDRDVFND